MLKQLRIQNFRCYKDSVITLNGSSILVGRNNAGKSTMRGLENYIICDKEVQDIKVHPFS